MTTKPIRRREALALLVRSELEARTHGYPTLREMSAKLCVSTRTLKRHLRDTGASYRELLDGVRQAQARELLARPGLTIEKIAERLGYSSGANFSRAFQRWIGIAPGQFREQVLPGAAAVPVLHSGAAVALGREAPGRLAAAPGRPETLGTP
jgi:AraC-like DNA-binding protein